MKTFVILFTLFYFLNALAVAPYGIKGREQSATLYSNVHQFPNNQVTNLGGINALVETGNSNLLINPSFEHSLFNTGWANLGTATIDFISAPGSFDGKTAAEYTPVGETIKLRQQSSINSTQLVGSQGLASIRVKSSVALKVCSFIDSLGATATNCVNVQANNQWGLYKVPFLLGSVSSGISVESVGNVTGTIYIDDAFVGPTSLTQNMNACQSVNCETTFSAKISSTAVVSDENLDWISTASGSGVYTVNFQPGTFTLTPNCFFTPNFNTGTNGNATIYNASSTSLTYEIVDNNNNVAQPAFLTCQKQGADFTAAKQLSNGNTYSSTNADTDWASCTPSSSQGFGTPTFAVQCKRQGGDLLMKGNFTPNANTAVEARLGLPLWNGVQLVSAGSSIIPSLQSANGFYIRSASSTTHGGSILIEPSVSYVTFGPALTFSGTTGVALAKNTADNVTNGAETLSITARIPIEGWQQSNIIIGQFNGLESCSSTLDCTDTFSAKVSAAGVVSDENVTSFINGSCSWASGVVTCGFTTGVFTVAPNCSLTPANTTGQRMNITSITASQFVASDRANDGTANTASDFHVICQKSGVDYIGKTARAVANDQSVRSIGSTGMDIQSVYAGSGANCASVCTTGNCTICNQTGSKITSVSFVTTGVYNVNGIDGTKYNCNVNAHNPGVSFLAPFHERSTSTSTFARIQTGNNAASANAAHIAITCIGIP